MMIHGLKKLVAAFKHDEFALVVFAHPQLSCLNTPIQLCIGTGCMGQLLPAKDLLNMLFVSSAGKMLVFICGNYSQLLIHFWPWFSQQIRTKLPIASLLGCRTPHPFLLATSFARRPSRHATLARLQPSRALGSIGHVPGPKLQAV